MKTVVAAVHLPVAGKAARDVQARQKAEAELPKSQ